MLAVSIPQAVGAVATKNFYAIVGPEFEVSIPQAVGAVATLHLNALNIIRI